MEGSSLIYVLEAKIQKQRLKHMKDAAKRRKINTTDTLSPDVTHIVTEFKEIAAVLRKLDKSSLDDLGEVNIVSVEWFTDSMKAGKPVPVLQKHKIQSNSLQASNATERPPNVYHMADYACQRATPLKHFNKKLTDALEVLELHAELRDNKQDYSRALAFRRASCVLKCLPFPLVSASQLRRVANIGDHSCRVIQEILEDGCCTEVENIQHSPWFNKMKLFSGIFGIGPSKAKQFIDNGWSSIQEAQKGYLSGDKRVQWGLAFHEDLATPVSQKEAEFILREVQKHVDRILPGAVLKLTGGFRRGKTTGHDVDILMTHPKLGKEVGLLPRLLQSLQSHDIILYGQYEKCTYTDEVLTRDFKLTARGQLDHFEKWLGICKVPKAVAEQSGDGIDVIYRRVEDNESIAKDKHIAKCVQNTSTDMAEKQAMEGGRDKHTTQDTDINDDAQREETEAAPSIQIDCDKEKSGDKDKSNGAVEKDTHTSEDGESSADAERRLDESLEETDSRYNQERLDHSDIIKLSKEPRAWIARRVDLIVSPYDQYFYGLVGWTGNKMFNRDLRWYAPREVNMKLTSHGLYDFNKGQKIPAKSEAEVFEHLQIPYREPEDRNC